HAFPVRRRHTLPDGLRAPRRLLGDVLHLHVVAGDRQGFVQQVRPLAHARAGRRPAVWRNDPGARRRAPCGRDRPRLSGPPLQLRRLSSLARRRHGMSNHLAAAPAVIEPPRPRLEIAEADAGALRFGRASRLAFAAIVLLFAAVRFWKLTAYGLFSDEVFSAETVHRAWPQLQR